MRFIFFIFLFTTSFLLKAQEKPNIILILTDDQGYGDFGSIGNPYLKTPNLDKLRSESITFNNYFTPSICAPTRAGIITGRYNYRTGVTDTYQSRVNMFPEEITIAEYLKTANYATGIFGKWHLGYNYPLRAMDQGFDTDVMWEEMQVSRTGPVMMENGKEVKYPNKSFLTDIVFEKATEFILEKAKAKKPFFTYIATYLPHTHADGEQVNDQYIKPYNNYDLSWHTKDVYGMIAKVDERVGKLMQKLKDLGIAENTIVIFTSDNGPQLGSSANQERPKVFESRYNGGLRGSKAQMYDGGIKVPMFIRWQGKFQKGKQINRMVSNLDILPTILDLCNIKANPSRKPDGKSLLPLIESDSSSWPDDRKFIYHFSRGENFKENRDKNYLVRTERYKMINGNQLYDIYSDPAERKNIAQKNPKLLKKLNQQYSSWFDDVTSWYGTVDRAANGIGYPQQKVTTLYYFEKRPNLGWPVDVAKTKNYTIVVEDIIHELFEDDSFLCLKINSKIYKQKILSSGNDITFSKLKLLKGRYDINVYVEGTKKSKEWRYRLEDDGYRRVRIF
ncbi:MAG: arylsulfatase [Jejuia sp.]